MDSGPVETGDKRRRRSRPRESHVSAPREATAPRSLGNSPLGNSAAALPEPGRAAPSNGGPGRGREGRRAAKLTPVSPASAPSAPQTSASSAPQASSSPAAAPARPAFDSSKIPVIPAWRLENEKERDTPNYIYAMRQQQVTRVRTEQLLWEKSAPKRDSSAGRAEANSESMAASASEDAVKRAAEREILSPAGRLLAIASRNRTPLSLSIEREARGRPRPSSPPGGRSSSAGRRSPTPPRRRRRPSAASKSTAGGHGPPPTAAASTTSDSPAPDPCPASRTAASHPLRPPPISPSAARSTRRSALTPSPLRAVSRFHAPSIASRAPSRLGAPTPSKRRAVSGPLRPST